MNFGRSASERRNDLNNGRPSNNQKLPDSFREELESLFIERLVMSGQLDFDQTTFRMPVIVEQIQRAAEVDMVKPPFKLRTGPENGEEIKELAGLMVDFMVMKGIETPAFMAGPSRKATVLTAATADELLVYGYDPELIIEDKGGPRYDLRTRLKERGIHILGQADIPKLLRASRINRFASDVVQSIRKDPRYYETVAGDEPGIAGATVILKALYEGRPRLNKKLVYGQNEDGAQPIRGDIKKGETAFIVKYPTAPSRFGLYGNPGDAETVLLLDDSVVSYRSLIRVMKKLKAANPQIKVDDIVIQVQIDELGWLREDFDEFISSEWRNSNPRIHYITTSNRIIEEVYKKRMSLGGRPLVSLEKYRAAQDYFDMMLSLGSSRPRKPLGNYVEA